MINPISRCTLYLAFAIEPHCTIDAQQPYTSIVRILALSSQHCMSALAISDPPEGHQ